MNLPSRVTSCILKETALRITRRIFLVHVGFLRSEQQQIFAVCAFRDLILPFFSALFTEKKLRKGVFRPKNAVFSPYFSKK